MRLLDVVRMSGCRIRVAVPACLALGVGAMLASLPANAQTLVAAGWTPLSGATDASALMTPGGLRLGQSLEDAVKTDANLAYGNNCFGTLAVSGNLVSEGELVHVMGYVDEARSRIDAIETNFVREVDSQSLDACVAAVREEAERRFAGVDWSAAAPETFFIGAADRAYIKAVQDGIAFEVWGDFTTFMKPSCMISWRAAEASRQFDVTRPAP